MFFRKKKKIIVAMSGGVDSSVTAQILKNQGHEVAAVFLHFWKDNSDPIQAENSCCSLKSLTDARQVCAKIDIPLYTLNFSEIFKEKVVNNFLESYQNGLTPNPCVVCNEEVKIGLLLDYAKRLGFDYVATGHYGILKHGLKITKFYKGVDKNKDQSYFLYRLKQEQLRHLLLPLGKYCKPEVRKIAAKFNLPVASKSDSQEICFVGAGGHTEFLKRHLKFQPGKIVDQTGLVVGEHQGLPLYTIGQRKGIEVGGTGPYYVNGFDYKNNILLVSNIKDDEALYKSELKADKVTWNSNIKLPLKCQAVIRYRHEAIKCKVLFLEKDSVVVKFTEKQRAVTPGQSIVFYDKNRLLGGGFIR